MHQLLPVSDARIQMGTTKMKSFENLRLLIEPQDEDAAYERMLEVAELHQSLATNRGLTNIIVLYSVFFDVYELYSRRRKYTMNKAFWRCNQYSVFRRIHAT
jgi:hypothetical protein